MPLGWRPADVAAKYPVEKIKDVYHFQKYDPVNVKGLMAWSWMQLIVLLVFLCYMFGNIAKMGSPNIFIYGAFIFLTVYAMTDLMDKNFSSIYWEFARCVLGGYIIFTQGDWFGASTLMPGASIVVSFYFFLSLGATIYFSFLQKKDHEQLLVA